MALISELKNALDNILETESKLIEYNNNSLQTVLEKTMQLLAERGVRVVDEVSDLASVPSTDTQIIIVEAVGIFYHKTTGTASPPSSYPAADIGRWVKLAGTGSDGKSAFELAVDEGFEGTLQEWLASLEGPAGPVGPQGAQGAQGIQGETGKGLRIEGSLSNTSQLPSNPADDTGAYLIPDADDPTITNIWVWNISEQQWENAGPLTTGGLDFSDYTEIFDTTNNFNRFTGTLLTTGDYQFPGMFIQTSGAQFQYHGDGNWTSGWFGYMTADKALEGDGEVLSVTVETLNQMGFDTDFVPKDWGKWKYTIYARNTDTYLAVVNGTEIDTGISGVPGDIMRLIRTGTEVKAQRSQDGGDTWTDLHTFSDPSEGRLYIKIGSEGASTFPEFKARKI